MSSVKLGVANVGSIEQERDFRLKLFQHIIDTANQYDGMLSRAQLGNYNYGGRIIRVIDHQGGIWNPINWTLTDTLLATLSINTTTSGTYLDQEISGGLWRYDYQTGGAEGKNTKLRKALEYQLPVIWFCQQEIGNRYVPYIVYIVEDLPKDQCFFISPDLSLSIAYKTGNEIERKYASAEIQRRLHQPAFRARVLNAYATRCAICNLGIGQLLEGAHIVPDSEESTSTAVSNGISLCKIHHAAYDREFLGIDAKFQIHIKKEILHIKDGPMLRYGLQEMHGRELLLPRYSNHWPSKERLQYRFEKFLTT